MSIKKISGTLSSISGHVNAASFAWQIVEGTLKWFHGDSHHHSIDLTDEDIRKLKSGGKVEFHYDCGTILVAQK